MNGDAVTPCRLTNQAKRRRSRPLERRVSEVIGPPAPQIVPESLENFHKNQSLRLSDLREITATVVDSAMLQWWLRGLSEISEKRLLNRQLGLEFVRPRCTGPEKDFVLAALAGC